MPPSSEPQVPSHPVRLDGWLEEWLVAAWQRRGGLFRGRQDSWYIRRLAVQVCRQTDSEEEDRVFDEELEEVDENELDLDEDDVDCQVLEFEDERDDDDDVDDLSPQAKVMLLTLVLTCWTTAGFDNGLVGTVLVQV